MNRPILGFLILALIAAAGTGGYWIGMQGFWLSGVTVSETPIDTAITDGPVIYYRDPDNKPFYSLEPRQSPDGRAWRAVLAGEEVSFDSQPRMATTLSASRSEPGRILYYRHPMGLPDISETPKKDSMGMDYIPVYEGEADEESTIWISPGRLQRTGVRSEVVEKRIIAERVRAPGTVQLDERRIAEISLRSEAFVESVANITTGDEVRKGQPLLQLYSPAVTAAAAEYLYNLELGGSEARVSAARQPLLNLAVPADFISDIEQTRKVPLTFTWTSPRDGIVLERNVVDGMRAMPDDELFRIADHAVVWALVEIAERDLALVEPGQPAVVRVRSYPSQTFTGKVDLLYPQLNPATRTITARIELLNPSLLLRPDMYVEAEIDTGSKQAVLAIPDNALIDSGHNQFVILDKGDGRFEHRTVQPGRRGSGYIEIIDGISEGDRVVISANFLIDAESNLRNALNSLGQAGTPK